MFLFWHFFFWIILFRLKPANKKTAFIDLRSFKILFLVNFRVFTLSESHHLLIKLSCESVCESLDPRSARSAVCFFFSQNCSLARSHRGRHCEYAFYIYTLLMHTNTRSIEAEWWLCSKTLTPEVGPQNLRACRLRRGSCSILERLVDACSW